jgi:glyoxylase-like metal-dependent hydrolase (beta-lactamase superfamily II)
MTVLKFSILSLILLLIAVIVFLVIDYFSDSYNTQIFQRNIISGYNSSSNNNTDKLPLITVKLIHSGNLKMQLSNALNLKHPSCAGIEDKEIMDPVFAYLIHHEKYGYFLIDSGCDSSYVHNYYGSMKGLLMPFVMPKTLLKPDEAMDKQLGSIRNDIKGVFFTHLHFDHASGLSALPDSLLYIAGKGERSLSVKWLLEPDQFKKSDTIYMLDFDSKESETLPLGKAIDVFGDKTLYAISTPGHSEGHVSYLVNTNDHPILIAGDACTMNKCLEIGAASGTSSEDPKQDQKTLEAIIKFHKDNPQVEIWPGHDFPKQMKQ